MSVEGHKAPYIISADTATLTSRWANKNGLKTPDRSFYLDLEEELKTRVQCFVDSIVEIVDDVDLRDGINNLAQKVEHPIISIDRVYADELTPHLIGYLDMTRIVDENFEDIPGLHPRPDHLSIEEQLAKLQSNSESPVVLLEDVIFSGNGIVVLADKLAKINRPVKAVICGIGISSGLEKIKEEGIRVECVREYASVIDEVCERDYFAGVPMSGRTVRCKDGSYCSAPYFHPFGNPESWASIPANHTREFSRLCMELSIALWQEIERESKTKIPTKLIPRRLKGVKERDSIVETLRECLDSQL